MSFKVPEVSIQHKILVGHLILFAIIACIFGILQHERMRISDIEKEARHIQQVQRKVNTAHRHITLLAMLGETAISWERKDFADYRSLRQYVDSTLLDIRKENEIHVARSQVDSLRSLLKIKEEHLAQIMYLIQSRDGHGVLQFSKIPYNVFPQTITRKKKGLAGFFGGKETVEVTPSTSAALHALNKELLSMQNELNDNIDVCTDSLRRHNKVINGKLRSLMTTMNDQAEQILEDKEKQLNASYDRSKSIITWLVISAVILLIVSYLIIQKDLREKQKTSKMLEETIEQNAALLQIRNKIILTISHDIRSPLNVISATVELARREVDNQRRDTYLSNIELVCLHVVHLLNNLLDVYRLNQSKEECNYVPFSLHEMLDRIASRFSGLVNDKGLLFNTSFDNTDVRLRGDVDRIEQIVGNLLSNAIKFTECGEISFHAGYSQGKLYLEVTDSGIGMTEETLARIFRPFERQMTANNTDGFGLGLSIIQGLVHLFNGEIDVKSKIHQGSTFKVTLPLEETDEPLECEKPVLTHTGHLPHNILVIDDDSMLRAVIKDLLERNGINCTTCASAKELVKEMREKDYDLLLTDIQMPGTNGFNLLILLRHSNIGNSRTIPVIAMTARGEQTKESLQEAGFTDCIYKPFSYNELLNLLSSINQCHVAASPPSDLDALLSEVQDKEKLLFTLIEQSRKDQDELLAALSASNRRQMREIVHRMQPVWELLHMEDILFEYRDILKDDQVSDVVLKNHTRQILSHVSTLMTKAEKELTRLKNEKESIDC